jgi:hypothetical protein
MKRIKTRLHFMDEAPRIGNGVRGVTVIVGRKWVRIVENHTGFKAKFSKQAFAKIFPEVAA